MITSAQKFIALDALIRSEESNLESTLWASTVGNQKKMRAI